MNDDSDIRISDSKKSAATAVDLAYRLGEPFDPSELRWKPRSVSGSRALAMPYLNVAAVITRLNDVLGIDAWEDSYQLLPSGSVVCRLRVRIGDHWVTREDVGSPSQQEAMKGCHSDALKRAARKFGVGLYLCQLGPVWAEWDPKKKLFLSKPQLPGWALPTKEGTVPAPPTPPAKDANGSAAKSHTMPANGEELERRLAEYDARLAQEGLWVAGDLLRHVAVVVAKAGPPPGYGGDVRTWPESAIALAVLEAKNFEREARKKEQRRRAAEERLTAPRGGKP
jgi:hypothetical protein